VLFELNTIFLGGEKSNASDYFSNCSSDSINVDAVMALL